MEYSNFPAVAIVILNWNGFHLTKRCLLSLEKISYPNYQVIVVDNASEDGSMEKLPGFFPKVKFIQNDKNYGFSGGCNIGIESALKENFEFILLLNNDTEVAADFLDKLLLGIQSDKTIGLVQPLILSMKDRNYIWSAGGLFNPMLGISKTLGDRKPANKYIPSLELDWATGCCILFRSSVLKEVGLFSNVFFAYFEDVDISLRIRKKGYGIRLVPESIIYHEGGASSKKKSREGTLSPTVFYLYARNQLFQLRKHTVFPGNILGWMYHLGRFMAWMVYFLFRLRIKKMKALLYGINDGLTLDPFSDRIYFPR
jgi:GT2 family glycosyltransferase